MSDLQLGLIVVGVLVVIAVIVFNRWQERQLRRREDTFAADTNAPFAEASGEEPPERVEPTLDAPRAEAPEPASVVPAPQAAPAGAAVESAAAPRSPIDYLCTLRWSAPIAQEQLVAFQHAASAVGKRVALHAWLAELGDWAELPLPNSRPILHACASLQLADRTGPVNRVQLSSMRDLVQQLARETGAECECPDIDAAAQAAADLDRFCAEVDVSISCHVVPKSDAGLPGTKVRGLLESSGYGLAADGKFWLHADDGSALLSAADARGAAFSPERLRNESLPGLTLSLDVPNAPASGRLFDRMLETARHLAHALDATVVDDNRRPLTDAGLAVIRQQVRAVQAAMEARGITAGSPTAARLFS